MKIDDDVGELDIRNCGTDVVEFREPKFMIIRARVTKSPSHNRITSGPSIVVGDRDAGRFKVLCVPCDRDLSARLPLPLCRRAVTCSQSPRADRPS